MAHSHKTDKARAVKTANKQRCQQSGGVVDFTELNKQTNEYWKHGPTASRHGNNRGVEARAKVTERRLDRKARVRETQATISAEL